MAVDQSHVKQKLEKQYEAIMKNNENIVVGIDIKDNIVVKYHYAKVIINDDNVSLVKLED